MMRRWSEFALSCVLAGLLGPTVASAAPQATQWGSVTAVAGGWAEDTMAVYINVALVNPGGCPVTDGGYATLPTDRGRDIYTRSPWLPCSTTARCRRSSMGAPSGSHG